jgi:hypothetical protein
VSVCANSIPLSRTPSKQDTDHDVTSGGSWAEGTVTDPAEYPKDIDTSVTTGGKKRQLDETGGGKGNKKQKKGEKGENESNTS